MADPADTVIKRPKLTDGNAAENDITGMTLTLNHREPCCDCMLCPSCTYFVGFRQGQG